LFVYDSCDLMFCILLWVCEVYCCICLA